MKKAFVSWSGGKDCCQAAYKAARQGYRIKYLFNMVNADAHRSCSHGIAASWINLQSEALDIPIIQQPNHGNDYEEVFTGALRQLQSEGITTGIFGDIDFNPHREWIERVCGNAGITPILPLWQQNHERVALDFVNLGFEAVAVAARADILGREWLGRKFNEDFLKDVAALNKEISFCGEAGEFHTLVIDGPLFKKRIQILESEKVRRGDHWFLDIKKCKLVDSCFRLSLDGRELK